MTDEPEPLFDIVAYGRGTPGRVRSLSLGEIQQVVRTVRRTPEVMVKVINKGAHGLVGVRRHIDYIGRKGGVELETDDGERLRGRDIGNVLQEEWNLDLIKERGKTNLTASKPQEPPRLVYKLIFSMPAGTPPEKVKTAVRNFAREEFALKHRYAMALHTDEPHPHVHLVLKATSEDGQRLYVRKAKLREWRAGFARHLRALGITANATPRYVRGEVSPQKPDGIYRARARVESTHWQKRVGTVARELVQGELQVESGKAKLMRTRQEVHGGWQAVSHELARQGRAEVASQVKLFVEQMPKPLTEKEYIASKLLEHVQELKPREIEMVR